MIWKDAWQFPSQICRRGKNAEDKHAVKQLIMHGKYSSSNCGEIATRCNCNFCEKQNSNFWQTTFRSQCQIHSNLTWLKFVPLSEVPCCPILVYLSNNKRRKTKKQNTGAPCRFLSSKSPCPIKNKSWLANKKRRNSNTQITKRKLKVKYPSKDL